MNTDPLAGLRPLHAPPEVSWWPPAPGWWALLVLVFALVLLALWWRRPNRVQQAALRELERVRRLQGPQQLAALNRLLKRYALACWPRAEVAGLSGRGWLEFLDAHGGQGRFSAGAGNALLHGPYAAQVNIDPALLDLVREWVRANRPGSGA